MTSIHSSIVERAIRTLDKGTWPGTVHLVVIIETCDARGRGEYVSALCGRRGAGEKAYDGATRCAKCVRFAKGNADG